MGKMNWTLLFSASLICTLLLSCGYEDEAGDRVAVPTIDLACAYDEVLACNSSQSGKRLYVGLTSDLNFNCSEELELLLFQNHFKNYFEFTGQAQVQFNGIFLNAEVSRWYDHREFQVFHIPNQPYKACAYIDLNGNGLLDLSEPIGSGIIDPSAAFDSVLNWTAYN